MKKEKLHYIIYKTTNLINNKYYIGQHQTYNLNDTYFGSGTLINRAIAKYGSENFKREILFDFDNFDEMNEKEKELVTLKEVKNPMCYNLIQGGTCNMTGMFSAKDKNGKIYHITSSDKRYLSGELVPATTGFATVKDKNGKTMSVDINDPRYLSGELISEQTGYIIVKDKDGKGLRTTKEDPRYLSGELVHHNKNMVLTKDNNGNILSCAKNDPRYLSGELKAFNTGLVTVKDINGITMQVSVNDPRYLSGELKSFVCGTLKVKDKLGNIFTIQKNDPRYLSGELVGWCTGRKWLHNINLKKNIIIEPSKINKYLKEGWKKGRVKFVQ